MRWPWKRRTARDNHGALAARIARLERELEIGDYSPEFREHQRRQREQRLRSIARHHYTGFLNGYEIKTFSEFGEDEILAMVCVIVDEDRALRDAAYFEERTRQAIALLS